ncbi:MAG: DoxX family membrane protein [Pseudomonadota bacterium]
MIAWLDLVGRILIAGLFVAGVVQKATDPAAVQGLLAGFGWPAWLVWPALVFNAGVAVGLLLPGRVQAAALAGAAYCMLTSVFHFIPGDGWQMSIFVKNWAIAGGLLVLAASRGR